MTIAICLPETVGLKLIAIIRRRIGPSHLSILIHSLTDYIHTYIHTYIHVSSDMQREIYDTNYYDDIHLSTYTTKQNQYFPVLPPAVPSYDFFASADL